VRCEERDSNIAVDLTETIKEETVYHHQSSIDQTLCVSLCLRTNRELLRSVSAVQLGPEHHDPGPVPSLGRGMDVQLAQAAAAGGGGDARTRITDVSRA
jgi:hypothetical protein